MVGVIAGVGVSRSLPGEGVVMVVGVAAEGEGVVYEDVVPPPPDEPLELGL
jgi:hypothetical protein